MTDYYLRQFFYVKNFHSFLKRRTMHSTDTLSQSVIISIHFIHTTHITVGSCGHIIYYNQDECVLPQNEKEKLSAVKAWDTTLPMRVYLKTFVRYSALIQKYSMEMRVIQFVGTFCNVIRRSISFNENTIKCVYETPID